MSTHGGEETWLMTLKDTYSKPDKTRIQIPGDKKNPEEQNERRERNIHFKSYLSQCKTCMLE
jgi:hypothetical protein